MKLAAVVVLAACGRIGFEARVDALGSADAANDSPALPFCQTVTATFCDDFDEGLGLSRWNNLNMFDGTLGVDAADSLSAPDAMAVAMGTIPQGMTGDCDATSPMLGMATQLSAAFDIAFEQIGTNDPVVFEMDLDDGTQTHAIELVERTPPGLAYIEDIVVTDANGMQQYTYDQLVTLDTGAWHHVAIDLVSGAGSQLTVAIDGTQLVQVVPSAANGGMTSVRAGIVYVAGPASPWEVHLDNIVLDAQ